jgi:hypothetical protein
MTLPTYDEMMIRTVAQWVGTVSAMIDPARPWIEATLRDRLRQGLTQRQKVIEAAERGDELSHAVLSAEFHELLDASVMPPASLRAYMAKTDKHPKRRRGHAWWADWRRHWVIVMLVGVTAMRFNLFPTRNKSSLSSLSASAVVARALQRSGFKTGVSESFVANLWGSRPYGGGTMGEVVAQLLTSSGAEKLFV